MLSYVLGGTALALGVPYAYYRNTANRSSWRFESIPDQSGKVVICTGANSGIGFHFCRHMARKKAHVIMACRTLDRGKEAMEAIKKEFPDASIEVRQLDVSNKKSIEEFAKDIMRDFDRLDVLNNNAGVMMQETFLNDGVDNTFATNNFGPFLLTGMLMPMLEKTTGARIVTISSLAHKRAKVLPWEQLNDPTLNTFQWKTDRYNISKLGNLLFTLKLSKLLQSNGSQVLSVGAHPGWSDTSLQAKVDNKFASFFTSNVLNKIFAQSSEMGAAPALMAATDPSIKNGEYIGPCGHLEMIGWPTRATVQGLGNDEKYGDELWEKAEDWTKFKFKF